MNLIKIHRIGNFFHRHKVPLLPGLIRYIIFFLYNSDVPSSVQLGKNCQFGHGGIGVVVHAKAKIGRDCIIGQGVTIGGKSREKEVPVLGDFVYVSAGARVIGPITIGDHVIIGANAVVTTDVKSNTMVGGVPAKVLKENILFEDYV